MTERPVHFFSRSGSRFQHTTYYGPASWSAPESLTLEFNGAEPYPRELQAASVGTQTHLCIVAHSGLLLHRVRYANGEWTLFASPPQPQWYIRHLAVAGQDQRYTLHLLVLGASEVAPGRFAHTLRHGRWFAHDQSWSRFDDVSAASQLPVKQDEPLTDVASFTCGFVGDELHVCLTKEPQPFVRPQELWHAFLSPDGGWHAFQRVDGWERGDEIACSGLAGELHVCSIRMATSTLHHAVRHVDGSWAFGETQTPDISDRQIAMTSNDGQLVLCALRLTPLPAGALVMDGEFRVPEALDNFGDVDTGVWVEASTELEFTAEGTIWAGAAGVPDNGPGGRAVVDHDPKFPLHVGPDAHPYSLIGKVGEAGQYFYVGAHRPRQAYAAPAGGAKLFLRTNDDVPGNGNGEFRCRIRKWQMAPTPADDDEVPWYTLRRPDGTWTPFAEVPSPQPRPYAHGVALAVPALPSVPQPLDLTERGNLLHLLGISSDGQLSHAIRFPGGYWSDFSRVGTPGEPGERFLDAGCAPVGDDLSCLAVTFAGRLVEAVRPSASQAWQPFSDITSEGGALDAGPFLGVACASVPSGPWAAVGRALPAWLRRRLRRHVLHMAAYTRHGGVWHAVRRPGRGWSAPHYLGAELGHPPSLDSVSCTVAGSELHLTAAAAGQLIHVVKRAGKWLPPEYVQPDGGGSARYTGIASAARGVDVHVVGTTVGGRLQHIVRKGSGGWLPAQDVGSQIDAGVHFGSPLWWLSSAHGVACSWIGAELHVTGVRAGGSLWHTRLRIDGAWAPLEGIGGSAGPIGAFRGTAVAHLVRP